MAFLVPLADVSANGVNDRVSLLGVDRKEKTFPGLASLGFELEMGEIAAL